MTLLFLFLVIVGCLAIWAFLIEPNQIQLNRHEVMIRKNLPRPLKILHLSDIHFAWPKAHIDRFFDRLAAEPLDFVFITGDIMDCDEGITECLKNLKKLKPKYGQYAVFGNHDYYNYRLIDVFMHNFPGQGRPLLPNNVETFQKALEEHGIRVMKNETDKVQVEGAEILIHGLDDPTTGRANVRVAMDHFDESKTNLLLTHTVDVFLDIGENEIDVSFSGHSHGGQIRIPLIGPVFTHTTLGRPYVSGLMDVKGAVCSISRGMNANRYLRARFLCPPEAIILTVNGPNV